VEVVATEENHELEVVLHPKDASEEKIIDVDMHDHAAKITFEQQVDLCAYSAGTCFHLEARACADHECETTTTGAVEFCLQ